MAHERRWLAGAALALGTEALYKGFLRPWMYNWGARPDEADAVLPGDELVTSSTPRTTRGVTIDAPVEEVWPWLTQMGGFYGYDWQELQVGDPVLLADSYGPMARQVVAAVEPKSSLVLMSESDFDRVSRGEQARGSWAFHLVPEGGRTRLLARGSGGAAGNATFDIPHFVMEQKMLRGIRDRAQASPGRDERPR
jgi:hypothetical protein